MRPAGLPTTAPCGTRSAYVLGCRCVPCTVANREYARKRYRLRRLKDDWNGLVLAEDVRQHLLKLRSRGVGRRSVAAACDVPASTLAKILSRQRTKVRQSTARRILAVTVQARGDAALVKAGRTWHLIGLLLEEGFTRAELARRLGYRSPALQFRKKKVLARTALRVEKLYRRLTT